MKSHLLLLGVAVTLSGCSSTLLRPVTNLIAAGGGAAAGSAVTGGKPVGAAVGAASGLLVSETFFHMKTKSEQRAYLTGYQQALSDQMKTQYWQQQFQHWPSSSSTLQVPVPVPELITPDGVRLAPATEFIQIHQ